MGRRHVGVSVARPAVPRCEHLHNVEKTVWCGVVWCGVVWCVYVRVWRVVSVVLPHLKKITANLDPHAEEAAAELDWPEPTSGLAEHGPHQRTLSAGHVAQRFCCVEQLAQPSKRFI